LLPDYAALHPGYEGECLKATLEVGNEIR